jgi:hypothetical protein
MEEQVLNSAWRERERERERETDDEGKMGI